MANITAGGSIALSTDNLNFGGILNGYILSATNQQISIGVGGSATVNFYGGFSYDQYGNIISGYVNKYTEVYSGVTAVTIDNAYVPAATLYNYIISNNPEAARQLVLSGSDIVSGSNLGDMFRMYDGDDYIVANSGNDTVVGDAGNDIVFGGQGSDVVFGGLGFDQIYGGKDADELFSGKDGDYVAGNNGNDTIYGNLGNDTMLGGKDADLMFGGKDDDIMIGDRGNDTLVGERGNDTLYGGDGWDFFVVKAGSGHDVVGDFNYAGGDRIITSGMNYTLGADGAGNAVLTLSSGDTLTLAGIAPAAFSADWAVGWELF